MQPVKSIKGKRIYVAGHNGLVGASLCRALKTESCDLLTIPRAQLDLRDPDKTRNWITAQNPDIIILAAAKVGGIKANMNDPQGFYDDNIAIQNNVVNAAREIAVEQFLFLGSSCIYPKDAPQPIQESALGSGPLEPTNAAYARAKIDGIKQCEALNNAICAMPCNLYGPGDRFDVENSHVIPVLIMKAHAAKIASAKTLEIWGSGTPRREFLYVDDLAAALIHLLKTDHKTPLINIGASTDITIKILAETICEVVGFDGALTFNTAQPDGVKSKLMDSRQITAVGWKPSTDLKAGLTQTYKWYLDNAA